MKVFMNRVSGGSYAGGLVVVAANTKEEAHQVFFSDNNYAWMMDNIDEFDSSFYRSDNWFECKELTANVDKPCVIIEDSCF